LRFGCNRTHMWLFLLAVCMFCLFLDHDYMVAVKQKPSFIYLFMTIRSLLHAMWPHSSTSAGYSTFSYDYEMNPSIADHDDCDASMLHRRTPLRNTVDHWRSVVQIHHFTSMLYRIFITLNFYTSKFSVYYSSPFFYSFLIAHRSCIEWALRHWRRWLTVRISLINSSLSPRHWPIRTALILFKDHRAISRHMISQWRLLRRNKSIAIISHTISITSGIWFELIFGVFWCFVFVFLATALTILSYVCLVEFFFSFFLSNCYSFLTCVTIFCQCISAHNGLSPTTIDDERIAFSLGVLYRCLCQFNCRRIDCHTSEW